MHPFYFSKVSASGFQLFSKQTLLVERSGAAFYTHCLHCWVVGSHLQVFWKYKLVAMLFSLLSVYKDSNYAIAISLSGKKLVSASFHGCQFISTAIGAIAVSFSRKKNLADVFFLKFKSFVVVSIGATNLLLLYALVRLAFSLLASKNNSY